MCVTPFSCCPRGACFNVFLSRPKVFAQKFPEWVLNRGAPSPMFSKWSVRPCAGRVKKTPGTDPFKREPFWYVPSIERCGRSEVLNLKPPSFKKTRVPKDLVCSHWENKETSRGTFKLVSNWAKTPKEKGKFPKNVECNPIFNVGRN